MYYKNYDDIGDFRACVPGEKYPHNYTDAWFRKREDYKGAPQQQIALARELIKVNKVDNLASKILKQTEGASLSRRQARVVCTWVDEVIRFHHYNFLPWERVEEIFKENA